MPIPAAPPARARDIEVDPVDEDRLIDLARRVVAAAARAGSQVARDLALDEVAAIGGVLEQRCGGAFVTLLEDGELRGCIGLLDPDRRLVESVAGAAIGAALHDWRFRPVTRDELPRLRIEVSVLGPFEVLEDPLSFEVGVDGLIVERGYDRGLLLPEVATEHGFDELAMLRATCGKAGLAADAWRQRGTRVSAFRTRRFGGPALAARSASGGPGR